jgi:hypothetical protein
MHFSGSPIKMDEVENSVVSVLAKVLMKLIEANEANGLQLMQSVAQSQSVTKFQSSCVPDVSVAAYLQRIRKYAKCSDACFVIALIYIDRIIELRNIVLSRLNIHRLLIASVQVAAKYLDDLFYNNAFYAKLGGVSTQEMNILELEFLMMIGFSLHVKEEIYSAYHAELKCYAQDKSTSISPASKQGELRLVKPSTLHAVVSDASLADAENVHVNRFNTSMYNPMCTGGKSLASPVGVDFVQPSPVYDGISCASAAVPVQIQPQYHPRPSAHSPSAHKKRSNSIVTPPLSAAVPTSSVDRSHCQPLMGMQNIHSFAASDPRTIGQQHFAHQQQAIQQQQILQQQHFLAQQLQHPQQMHHLHQFPPQQVQQAQSHPDAGFFPGYMDGSVLVSGQVTEYGTVGVSGGKYYQQQQQSMSWEQAHTLYSHRMYAQNHVAVQSEYQLRNQHMSRSLNSHSHALRSHQNLGGYLMPSTVPTRTVTPPSPSVHVNTPSRLQTDCPSSMHPHLHGNGSGYGYNNDARLPPYYYVTAVSSGY